MAEHITRRKMLNQARGLVGAATVGLPLVGSSDESGLRSSQRKLRVVFVGGHPDDPQSGCGGTMARYADLSVEVVALFLTRGERGIPGKSPEETAAIRTAEAQKSCEILKARPLFGNQFNGNTEINNARYEEFRKILETEQPDLVFTHWPIDTHPDHRVASLLAYDAWLRSNKKFHLYFYEVELGSQTQDFWPTVYVDITQTEARKRAACYAHASTVSGWYPLHEAMHRFRGIECGCKSAEAFVRHVPGSELAPPLPAC